jgi:hypothetical protein
MAMPWKNNFVKHISNEIGLAMKKIIILSTYLMKGTNLFI